MKLEAIMKLIKDNTNCLGYINSSKLEKDIKDIEDIKEMKISIIKEPNCSIENKEIISSILIPLAKAKGCIFKEGFDTLAVYARGMFPLRIVDRACILINSQLGETYKFKIITNYDVISMEKELKEVL